VAVGLCPTYRRTKPARSVRGLIGERPVPLSGRVRFDRHPDPLKLAVAMRRSPKFFLRAVPFLAFAVSAVQTAPLFDGDAGGVINLPMDVPAVKLPPTPGVTEDEPLRTFRVGRESRPARVIAGPHTLKHTVTVPAGGGRFET